jgi:hypothetical protein
MATLSISEVWNETASFSRREAQLLFPVAFLLMALPGAVMQLLIPPAIPGQPPEPGLWLALMPVTALLSMIGAIAISHLALRPGSSVGEGLQLGARRFLVLFGAAVLVAIGAVVVLFPLAMIAVLITGAGPEPSPAAVLLLLLLILPALVFLWVRLVLLTPVAAAEAGGPIAIIQRSWTLTQGHFWPLLGFLLVFVLVVLVVSIVVGAIGGLLVLAISGPPQPGSLSLLLVLIVSALVNCVITALFTVFLARLYDHLTGGPDRAGVFA